MSVSVSTQSVGPYEIDRELGRGAFGVVYRAAHRERPDTPVALKVIQGRGDTDRLLLEPAVLSRLKHPGIVGLLDYFLRGDDLVLALEFIDGVDLKTLLEDGQRFSQDDVRDLLIQIGDALAEAHDKNVVHRDLKPANILVQKRTDGCWRFVLTDFGIGQVRQGLQLEKRTGGTYLFMAPEQLRGRPGTQSDLWALGVVAYRLLTGKLPFPGPTLTELTNQILYGAVTPPSVVCAEPIDPRLERAIMHLLDRSLSERTASAQELLRDLDHRGKASTVRTAPTATTKAARTTLDKQLNGHIRSRSIWLTLCLVCYFIPNLVTTVFLGGGLVLFYLAQRRPRLSDQIAILGTAGAFSLMAINLLITWFFPQYNLNLILAFNSLMAFLNPYIQAFIPRELQLIVAVGLIVGGIILGIVYLFLPVIAASHFAELRRLQREKLLRNLALEGNSSSEEYLTLLRQALDSRFEDVGLHLKYAEALFARGKLKEAAVEARLILRHDPYNFSGNLLLANAYHGLRLDQKCLDTCEGYLKISGYCFEFSELAESSRRRLAA